MVFIPLLKLYCPKDPELSVWLENTWFRKAAVLNFPAVFYSGWWWLETTLWWLRNEHLLRSGLYYWWVYGILGFHVPTGGSNLRQWLLVVKCSSQLPNSLLSNPKEQVAKVSIMYICNGKMACLPSWPFWSWVFFAPWYLVIEELLSISIPLR